MRRIAAASLIMAAILAGGTARAATVESKAYVGVAGEITVACLGQLGGPDIAGIGGSCFTVDDVERVHVLVDDAVTGRTSFKVAFYGPTGRIGSLKAGCGDYSTAVPADATLMRVFVGIDRACPDGTTGGLGTIGFITVVKSAPIAVP